MADQFPATKNKGLLLNDNLIRISTIHKWSNKPPSNSTNPAALYQTWVNNRVAKALGDRQDRMSISHLVNLSAERLALNWPFISALVSFWNPSINQFQFLEGWMTITLLDVVAMTATPLVGVSLPVIVSEDLHARIDKYLRLSKGRMPSSYSELFPKEVSELSTGEQLSYKKTVDFY